VPGEGGRRGRGRERDATASWSGIGEGASALGVTYRDDWPPGSVTLHPRAKVAGVKRPSGYSAGFWLFIAVRCAFGLLRGMAVWFRGNGVLCGMNGSPNQTLRASAPKPPLTERIARSVNCARCRTLTVDLLPAGQGSGLLV
jgi:hypothetical protein